VRDRRDGLIIKVEHGGRVFDVGFYENPDTGRWAECFYSRAGNIKQGSDFDALLSDACIAVSKLVEAGHTFASLTLTFGEDRAPGQDRGPPSSLLGAICAAGAKLA
jgi:hypothetical protein